MPNYSTQKNIGIDRPNSVTIREKSPVLTKWQFRKYFNQSPNYFIPCGSGVCAKGEGANSETAYRAAQEGMKRRIAEHGANFAVITRKRRLHPWYSFCFFQPAFSYELEAQLYTTAENSVLRDIAITENGVVLKD